jgi:hypothetical protein
MDPPALLLVFQRPFQDLSQNRMKNTTMNFLSGLVATPWLHELGVGETAALGVRHLNSKQEAFRSFLSEGWSNFRLMLKNRNAVVVNRSDYARFLEWNKIANLVREEFKNVAVTNVKRALVMSELHHSALSRIAWDVLNTALEIEYADLLTLRFYHDSMWPFYEQGHLPCGWEGPSIDESWASVSDAPLPGGKLLVY